MYIYLKISVSKYKNEFTHVMEYDRNIWTFKHSIIYVCSTYLFFLFFPQEENADPHSVLKEATELLQTKFGFYNTTIQVEPYCEDMIHCTQCQDPMD